MSGHSKWSTIKRQKGVADTKRSAAFGKLSRLITIAARTGGKDPAMNFRLRLAIDKAREVNMPNANIDRAIAAGSGEGKGEVSKEALYEGFGPGGVAIMIQAITDNSNRTSAEIRSLLSKAGGSLGAHNSVGWMFSLVGIARVLASQIPTSQRERVLLDGIDAGVDDIRDQDDQLLFVTSPDKLQAVKNWLESQSISVTSAQLEFLPTTTVAIDQTHRDALYSLLEELDNHPDVTDVFSNDA